MGLTNDQRLLLRYARKVAQELSGTSLTGLIGELSACEKLGMKWDPSEGYDCIDGQGEKVEIKTRRDSKGGEVDKKGRMGIFGKKGVYGFSYGLYLALDKNYDVIEILKLNRDKIKKLENKENRGKQKRSGLHISTFIKEAEVLYPPR